MWVALFRAPLPCEKTQTQVHLSCTQINAFVKSLRQTQTLTMVATPQLLTSLQCQIKELVPPRLLSARQTPSFLSRRHTQRNRSTRTRAGTQPQPTNKERKQASCSSVATVSSALGDTAVQFSSEHSTPLP